MSIGAASPFWTLDPYSDPAQLFGGIRKHVAVLNAIQADAFREASQNQQVTQSAQSQYGAQTTNDQTQTATLSQAVVATNFKQVHIDSERQILVTDTVFLTELGPIADLTTDLNDLELDNFIDDGPDPAAGPPIITPLNPNTLIPGDEIFITGTEVDGTPVSGAFTYGPANDGTTVGDLVNFISALYTTATADYPLAGPDVGRIRLQADFGGPQALSINLSNQANFNVVNANREVVSFAETSGDVTVPNETETGSVQMTDFGTGLPATAATTFANLVGINGNPFVAGDVINITGTDAAGGAVAGAYVVVNPAVNTLGNLLAAINALYLAGGGATSSIDANGRIVLTAASLNELTPHLDLNLASNPLNPGNTDGAPFGAFTLTGPVRETHTSSVINRVLGGLGQATDNLNALTIVNQNDPLTTGNRLLVTGTDKTGNPVSATFLYGTNGTTLQDLVNYIDALYPNVGVTFDNATGRIVLKEDMASANPPLDLILTDPGPNIQLPAFSGRPALPLFSYLAGSDAADYLSRAAAKAFQNQGADQSAVGKDKGFTGAGSKAYNNLSQDAQATQTFDVDIDSTVVNSTTGVTENTLFNKSRFRQIEVKDVDNAAQAIFTSGQRQGYTADPVSQTAVSGARNVLAQTATLDQTGDVLTTGTHNLRRWEESLVPRTTDILAQVENNSSINSSAAAQEQNLQQNGGTGKAKNDSTATAVNADAVTVTNTVSILI